MVVLIACVTCAKAKARCDKKVSSEVGLIWAMSTRTSLSIVSIVRVCSTDSKFLQIPCSRCVTKRIQCRPRGDRRFSDGQTELSLADIEMIAAANGGTSGVQTPSLSRQPSVGTPSRSRRQSRQHTPQTNPQSTVSISNPINIPWPTAQFSLPTLKDPENEMSISPTDLSGLRYHPSAGHNPMLNDINPAAIHTTMPLSDQYFPQTSEPMQTDLDLPNLDLSMFPEFSLPFVDSPFLGSFSDLQMGNGTPAFSASRAMSYDTLPSLSSGSSSDGSSAGHRRAVEEHDHIAEVEESWPAFRCNPPKSSASYPSTSGIYLDGLFTLLRNHEAWSSWTCKTQLKPSIPPGRVSVEPFDDVSREKLTVVTQSFLYHALDVHKARSMNSSHSKTSHSSGFMILPPAKTLEYFLSAYVRHFETYSVCRSGNSLKPNWLLHQSDANLSSLLILLMLAYGAAAESTPEARYLSSGLIEVCRISWQNVVEHDIELTREPTALLSGLLLTTLQAWSGDKAFMEAAMGQRDSYINVSVTTCMCEVAGLI
jgi:hypothetical protein